MYLGIIIIFKEKQLKKTGKKKKERNEQGSNPAPFGSLRTLPNHYTTKADYVIVAKSVLFNAFSTENPPANAVKDDRAA